MSRLAVVSILASVLLVSFLAFSLVQRNRQSRKARQWGCKPVRPRFPRNPLGLKNMWVSLAARRKKVIPSQLAESMDEVGINAHTTEERFLMNSFLMTRDPENIKTILSTQVSHWELGAARGDIIRTYLGTNLFTAEGKAWKASRSLVRPQFYLSQISTTDLFEKHLQELCRMIECKEDGWSSHVDLEPLFGSLVLDVASEFLFGYSIHSQNPLKRLALPKVEGLAVPDPATFGKSMDEASNWASTIAPLGGWAWLVPSLAYRRNIKETFKLSNWFVHENLAHTSDPTQTMEKMPEKRYFVLNELTKLTCDPQVLSEEIISLLSAARSTTASLLGWTIYYLARQPETYDKLRSAIQNDVGLDPTSHISDISILRGCHYLQNCINEALRLGNPSPFTARSASQDTTLPRGGGHDGCSPIFVPKGTMCSLFFHGLHHRADLYGADVEEFKPERWEHRDKGWEMTAFGGGPRACIGQQFALNQVSYVITRLVQRYDKIECTDPCREVKYETRFTQRSGTGVQVRLHEAEYRAKGG